MFTFRLGGHRPGVRPALYSIDRSLFRFAAPGATDRGLVRLDCAVALDERGDPLTTGQGRSQRGVGPGRPARDAP